MRTARARCPTCKRPVRTALEERPADYPFCSRRCRLIDLKRWFDGDYRIPVTAVDPEDEEGDG